jgi:hypothetical protein
MVIGDPNTLAIESEIVQVFETSNNRALGFFCVHVGGFRYGVKSPDATMLGNSVDQVSALISERGQHTAPFANEDAFAIAKAFRRSVYEECASDELVFGLTVSDASSIFQRSLQWAPDGDEAFDDGSYILQFDIGSDVRVIGFQTNDAGEPIRDTLRDITLPEKNYYKLLCAWLDAFHSRLATLTKIQ